MGALPDFSRRELHTPERMDDPDCDLGALHRTYEQFDRVNALVAGWPLVYRSHLRPRLRRDRATTLLDIGCGGGDVARHLIRWAARDGFTLRVLGIDADERAIAYAGAQPPMSGLHFRRVMSRTLVEEGQRFDLIISNHMLHHLSAAELTELLRDCEMLGRHTVHSDIERSALAWAGFGAMMTPFFRRSFIVSDGMLSVRRSYRAAELRRAVLPGWRVERPFPFRLLLTHSEADHA
ncbi:MAG: class I SAM-dependent methyltransferase [Deinococcus sp.]|nr:class I SAM-dependent methyltransferase [Deinococcus sp.]